MASKEQEIKMINYFANNLDRLQEKDTDKPYKEMKTKFKFQRSVSFLRDRFLNVILPNLFKYECLDNATMVIFYDKAGMEIPDELVAMIDVYCKLHGAPGKKDLDTISISSTDSEDDIPKQLEPKKPTPDLDTITIHNTESQSILINKTHIHQHDFAPGKRDFDTISISSTDSADDMPPTKLPKQLEQNPIQKDTKTDRDTLTISKTNSQSILPININPDQSTQQNEILIKTKTHLNPDQLKIKPINLVHLQFKTQVPTDPDQFKINQNVAPINQTKENETQTDVATLLNQIQVPNQLQIILTKTNRDQSTNTEITTTDPITQIEQNNIESDQLKASKIDVTQRNQFISELDNSCTDSNMSIISLNTKLGLSDSQYERQQNTQSDIDEDQLRLIDKYALPLTHLDQYKTYQFDSPVYSPIQAIPDQCEPQFNVVMDLDETNLCRSQLVQTTDIQTENKCTVTDPKELDHISDWHLIPAEGTLDAKWGMLDHFFIPKSEGTLLRYISEKHQIPVEQIHTVDETNYAHMLEFKTLKSQCENLLWPKSKKKPRKTKKINTWIREFNQNDSNIQICQKDTTIKSKTSVCIAKEITNTPIVTKETISGGMQPIRNIYETKMTFSKLAKTSDSSKKIGKSRIKIAKNNDISINTTKNSKNSFKVSENSDISIKKLIKPAINNIKTTDHGDNSIKNSEIFINSSKNGKNVNKTSKNGDISIKTTKICDQNNETKTAKNSDLSIKAVRNSGNSIKTTEICDHSIKTSANLNVSVNDEMNSSKSSESFFCTAEGNETDAYYTPAHNKSDMMSSSKNITNETDESDSSPVLNNRVIKRTESDINKRMEVSGDSASNMLLSIDSGEMSSVNNQVAASMSENSSIFLPSDHNTDNTNDIICDESFTLSVNNKNKTISRKLSEQPNTINKLPRLKLNKHIQIINLNTNKQHKIGNNSNDSLSIEDEVISTKTSENNKITTNNSNASSPSSTVTRTAISKETCDKKCESVTLFKQIPLKSTKNEITTKLKLSDFVLKKNEPETDSMTHNSSQKLPKTGSNNSLSPSKSDNINRKSVELRDFFSGSLDAVMNFIANPNQKIVTSTQIERLPLKSLDISCVPPKKFVCSKSPRSIINDSIDDVMNYITSPSHNIVTSTQIDISPHNNSNPNNLKSEQNINFVSGNSNIAIPEKPRVVSENSNKCPEKTAKCTQTEQIFSDNLNNLVTNTGIKHSENDYNVNNSKNVNSTICTQNKQSVIAPYIVGVSPYNLASTSRFVTNCVIDPNANYFEKNKISQTTISSRNTRILKYSKENVTVSSNEYSSMGTSDESMNSIHKNNANEERVFANSLENKRKTPETYAFAQSSKDSSMEISTTLSVTKRQEIFKAIESAAVATAQHFELPPEYKLRTPQFLNAQFDNKNVTLKTTQNKTFATKCSPKLQNKPNTKLITSTTMSGSSIQHISKSTKDLFDKLVPNSVNTSKSNPGATRHALLEEFNKIHCGHMHNKYKISSTNVPEHGYAAKYYPLTKEPSEYKSKSRLKKELKIQTYKNRKALVLKQIHLELQELANNQNTPSTNIKLPLPPKNDCVITNTPKQQVTVTDGQPEQILNVDPLCVPTQCDSTMSPTLASPEVTNFVRLVVIPNKLVPQHNRSNVDQKVSPEKPESLIPNAKVTPLLIRRNSKTKWESIPILPEENRESVHTEKTKLKDNSQLISPKDDCLNTSKRHQTNDTSITPIITNLKDVVTPIDKISLIAPNANQTVTSTDKPELLVQNTKLSPVNVGSNLKTKCLPSAVLNSSEETKKLNDSVNTKVIGNALHNNTQLVPLRDNCLNPSKRHRTMNDTSITPIITNLLKDVVTPIDKISLIAPNINQTVTSTKKPESVVQNMKLPPVNIGSNLKTKCLSSAVLNSSEETRKLNDSVNSKVIGNALHNNTQLVPLRNNCLNSSKRHRTMNDTSITPIITNLKDVVTPIDKISLIAPNVNQTVTSTDKPELVVQNTKLSPVNVGSNLKIKCLSSAALNSSEETRKLNDSVNTKVIGNALHNNTQLVPLRDNCLNPSKRYQTTNDTSITPIITNLLKDIVTPIDKISLIAPNVNQTVTSTNKPELDVQNTKLSPVNVGSNLKTKCLSSAVLNSSEETRKLNDSVNTKEILNALHNNTQLVPLRDNCLNPAKRKRTFNESNNILVNKKPKVEIQIPKIPPVANQTVTSTKKSKSVVQSRKLSPVNVGSNLKTKFVSSTEETSKLNDSVNKKVVVYSLQNNTQPVPVKEIIPSNRYLLINESSHTSIKTKLKKYAITQIDNIAPNANQTVNIHNDLKTKLSASGNTQLLSNPQKKNNSPLIIKDVCIIPSSKQLTINKYINTPIIIKLQKDLVTQIDKISHIAPNDNQTDSSESILQYMKLIPVNIQSNLKTKLQNPIPLNSLQETRELGSSVNTKMISNLQQTDNSPFIIKNMLTNPSNKEFVIKQCIHTPPKTKLQKDVVTQIDKNSHIAPNANQTVTSSESILQNVELPSVNLQCSIPLNSLIEAKELASSVDTKMISNWQQAPNSPFIIKDVCTIPSNKEHTPIDKSPVIVPTSNKTVATSESILQNETLSPVNLLSDQKTKWQCSTPLNSLIETRELGSSVNDLQQAPNSSFIIKDASTIPINRELAINKFINTKISTKLQKDVALILEISMSTKNNDHITSEHVPENTVILIKTPNTELNSTIVTDELSTNIELIRKVPEIVSLNDGNLLKASQQLTSSDDALQTQKTKVYNKISKSTMEHKTPKQTTELNSTMVTDEISTLMLKDPQLVPLNDGNSLKTSQEPNTNDVLPTENTKLVNEILKSTRKRKGEELDASWNDESPQLLTKKAKLHLRNDTNSLKKPITDQTHEKVSVELRKSNSDEKKLNVDHLKMNPNCSPASKKMFASVVEPFDIDSVCIHHTNASTISDQLTCKLKENYNSEQSQICSKNESAISCTSTPISNKNPSICDNSLKSHKFSSPNSSLWTTTIVSDSEPNTPEYGPISIQKPIEIKQNILYEHLCRELPSSNSPIQLNTIVSDLELRTPGSRITPIQESIKIKQEIVNEPQLDEHLYRILPRANQPIALNSELRTPGSQKIPIQDSIEIKQEQLDESLYADLMLAEQTTQLLNADKIKEEIVEPLAGFSQRHSCEHLMSKKSKMVIKELCIDTTHLDVKRIVSNIANDINIRFEKEEIDDVTVNPIFEVLDTKQELNLDDDNTVT